MIMFQDNRELALGCEVVFNGDVGFKIGEGKNKHTIYIDKKLCTYKAWELTGIPCSHTIRALSYIKVDLIVHISDWYHKSKYLAVYQHPL